MLFGKVAGYLVKYYFNSLRVRATHIAVSIPLPEEIIELENYQFWQLNLWSSNFKLNHGRALNSIAKINAKKITDLIEDAKESPEMIKSIFKEAEILKEQIDAANNLLEKLNG